MADSATRLSDAPTTRRPWSRSPLVLTLGCAAAYGVFLVLPHYSHVFPLDTTLGHMVFSFGGVATVLVGPGVELAALAWALLWLWRDRGTGWRTRGTSVVAAGVALGTLVWLATPYGIELMTWWLE